MIVYKRADSTAQRLITTATMIMMMMIMIAGRFLLSQ